MPDEPSRAGRSSRRRVLQFAACGGLTALPGCSFSEVIATPRAEEETRSETPTGRGSNVFTVVQADVPDGVDPLTVADEHSRMVFHHVFEGLYEYERTTDPLPRLAADTPEIEDDGRTWTVPLDSNGRFQNADPVRAEDVKYSYEAPVAENTDAKDGLEIIDQITVVDAKTVRFDLERPLSSFIQALTHPVVPKSVREQDKPAFNGEGAVGSGPFELRRWNEQAIRLGRWDGYWRSEPPELELVDFVPITGSEDRIESVQDGRMHVVELSTEADWAAVTGMDGTRVRTAPKSEYYYLGFNCKEGPTTDRQVRTAVDAVIDMDAVIEEVVDPVGTRQYSPVPRPVADAWDFPVGDWQTIPRGKDLSAARQLFETAEVPLDYPWTIIVPPDDRREGIARRIQTGLEDVGFTDVTVERLQWGAMLTRYTTGNESDYNIFAMGWAAVPDPDAFAYPLFARTARALGRSNGTFYGANSQRGKATAEKIVSARETPDRETRRQLYIEAFTNVLEDRAHLPAYTLVNGYAHQADVQNLGVAPNGNRLDLTRTSVSTQS